MALPNFGKLFKKNGIAEQILVWQVLGQVLGALMTPLTNEIRRTVNEISQTEPLSPAQLADMVVRNVVGHDDATAYAKQSGIAPSDFDRMVGIAGDAPSPTDLVEALRREIIPATGKGPNVISFEQGIAETRLKDKWTDMVRQLADRPLPPAEAVDAVVESQIPLERAQHEAFLSGFNAERFTIMVNTRGNPPSPTELIELVRRGFIPLQGAGPDVTSLEQGIYEGSTKNKWEKHFEQLVVAHPPPRTTTALLRNGSITDAQAAHWFADAGLSAEAVTAYVADAHHQRTAAHHQVAQSTVAQLYNEKFIDRARAEKMLGDLHYSKEDAGFILDLEDFKVLQQALQQARSRIHQLYTAHKIDNNAALNALNGLGIPAGAVKQLLETWSLERRANVQVLTAGEIADAVYYGIIEFPEAVQQLVNKGFTEHDAAIRIAIRLHGKPPPTPK